MTSANKRWRTRDSLWPWLCLAIALHFLLLLVPARQEAPATASNIPMNLRLIAPPDVEKPFVEENIFPKKEEPAIGNVSEAPALPEEPALASQEQAESPAKQESTRGDVVPSTARLLDSASEIKWPLAAVNDSRRLGIFVPHPRPENWRSGIRIEDNLFNGMVLPSKTEIVDRWLSVDGTQNVVIHTPGGHTLCGRVQAWDPMQALDERLMHFRPCAGGGKRTFEMNKRPAYDRLITPMANSTIN
jgi:hypothetical protein